MMCGAADHLTIAVARTTPLPASAGAGLLAPVSLVAKRGQQALEQPDLGGVETPGDPVGAFPLLGLRQALLRRLKLLAQLGVLRRQPALFGLYAGQLLLKAGHGLLQRGIARPGSGRPGSRGTGPVRAGRRLPIAGRDRE